MPDTQSIRLITREQRGGTRGYWVKSVYLVFLANGDTKFIEASESLHDPNGNGTGNFSHTVVFKILDTEEMEEELKPMEVEMIGKLIVQNSTDGTMEIKVSNGAEDRAQESAESTPKEEPPIRRILEELILDPQ